MNKSNKKSQKKESEPLNGENKNTKSTRRKIEDILDKRHFDNLFDL